MDLQLHNASYTYQNTLLPKQKSSETNLIKPIFNKNKLVSIGK